MIAATAQAPNVESADAIIGGRRREAGDVIAKLEKEFARHGDRARARALHEKRLEVDKARAEAILSGAKGEPAERLALAKRLAADKCIGLARRVLKGARQDLKRSEPLYLEVFQKSVLYTYKDPDLPVDWRLDRAMDLLEAAENLATTTSPESLGLAGAIYKRKWEVDSGRHHLERALSFYLRGYMQGAPSGCTDVLQYLEVHPTCVFDGSKDQGYTGINAAFLMDLVARQEEEGAVRIGMPSPASAQRREGARLIREEIIRSIPCLGDDPAFGWLKEQWWFYATIGEAHFGLGVYDSKHYGAAVEWLLDKPATAGLQRRSGTDASAALDIPEWEFESTARQLARLALLQGPPEMTTEEFEASAAGKALAAALLGDQVAVRSAFRGKVGLALSGGGFRAALFHIGVLANLAERDMLRHVEVLSCVSGGSIIGAHYYLELRHLLQSKPDGEIAVQHYVALVERVERAFLQGVQRNIRMRVLAEWTTNLKMIFSAGYSRTMRVGELYERELFSLVEDGHVPKATGLVGHFKKWHARREPRWIDDLFIHPMRENGTLDKEFQPRNHNWRRKNKVPALILNATSLNTGHGWQFTASFMGEPPTPINTDIDANERLRRMYYADAPDSYKKVRLGHAVGASSCVPGLFEPLILDGLYPGRSVRLVDGGVCDNQGIASLLEQDCTVPLVSDASGQMDTEPIPSSSVIGVPLRSNSILQARVREAQYTDVATRRRSLLLRGLMFLHLKRDLSADQVGWVNIPSSRKQSDFAAARDSAQDATSYGISADMQRKLAAIRTDLDSFSDVEAYALMASAYAMTDSQLDGANPSVAGFGKKVATGNWSFTRTGDLIRPLLTDAKDYEGLKKEQMRVSRLLEVGSSIGFKIWKLSPFLIVLKWILAVALILAPAWFLYTRRDQHIIELLVPTAVKDATFGVVGWMILTTLVVAGLGIAVNKIFGEKVGSAIMKSVKWRETVRSVIVGVVMALGGFLVARAHLHLFDRRFLAYGKLPKSGDRD